MQCGHSFASTSNVRSIGVVCFVLNCDDIFLVCESIHVVSRSLFDSEALRFLSVDQTMRCDGTIFSCANLKFLFLSLRRRPHARNVSTSFLPSGGITYSINSFDYPNLLCFNSPPTQHQFL